MYAPDEQQMEICLLKLNLEEIENDLVSQSTLPLLDSENEQQYRETMKALRAARAINVEMERLKQENVRLIAKRLQLKSRCEEASKALENARDHRNNMINLLNTEEEEEAKEIKKYEDSLKEKADRFRKARSFYNEEEMSNEIKSLIAKTGELSRDVERRETNLEALTRQLGSLTTDVPEDIVNLLGKQLLEDKLDEVKKKCEETESNIQNVNSLLEMRLFFNKTKT